MAKGRKPLSNDVVSARLIHVRNLIIAEGICITSACERLKIDYETFINYISINEAIQLRSLWKRHRKLKKNNACVREINSVKADA